MKHTMKKLLLGLIVLSSALSTKSQTVYVQGGVNLANISNNTAGQTSDRNTLTTFNAGVLARFGISPVFDLESGLLLTGHGSKSVTYFTSSTQDNYVKAKFNPYYVELPLNALVKFPLAKSAHLFVSAGPYVAIGVGGKSKLESRFGGATTESTSTIKFSKDDPTTTAQEGAAYDRLKRFDYGANFGAGIDFGSAMIKLGYGLGLAKINSTQTNNNADDKNKYRTWSISVGIPLGK